MDGRTTAAAVAPRRDVCPLSAVAAKISARAGMRMVERWGGGGGEAAP